MVLININISDKMLRVNFNNIGSFNQSLTKFILFVADVRVDIRVIDVKNVVIA